MTRLIPVALTAVALLVVVALWPRHREVVVPWREPFREGEPDYV